MPITTCFVFGAALVLFAAGAAKVARPTPTVTAIRNVGVDVSPYIVTAMAVAEMGIGVVVLLWGAWPSLVALGLAYAGFAAFTALALARPGREVSCGCFGARSTPVHPAHVIVNVAVFVVALVAAGEPPGSIDTVVRSHPGLGGALVVSAVAVGLALYLALTVVPELLVGFRSPTAPTR